MDKNNESMLIDFYEFTMANGYFESNYKDTIVYFDLFFRKIPSRAGYAIAAGLKSVIDYIENLSFSEADIAYLKKRNIFHEDFLEYLRNFRFTGDIYAVEEGSVVFPKEPILTVRANVVEAQLIETYLLVAINHQSLIATKAARIKHAAQERLVIEMGARRAHGVSSANLGARAAYIGGADSTSNTLSDRLYNIPAAGTMAHSWVQMFEDEYQAFLTYAKKYPNASTFLVDTYDTIKQGIPNAIKVINDYLKPNGYDKYAIRIDSGDLTYLSQKARRMLDEAGLKNCKIVASNALDEHLIRALITQGAPIDVFGVGERLITAKADPVFGGVYKLVAKENPDGSIEPKIKISDNPEKITTPHFKKTFRIYDKDTDKACADLIALHDEEIDEDKPLTLFDPTHTWQQQTFTNYYVKSMQKPIFKDGKLVYELPDIKTIKAHCEKEKESLWEEVKRFDFPHQYYVDLSEKLWNLKHDLIKSYKQKKHS